MRKILLTIIGLALASSAWSAQTAVTQISGTQPSVGALKTQVNTKLGTVESNRQDHETRVAAMESGKETKAVVQASAPADTTVDWYDTDQESGVLILKRHNGTTWLRASSHGVQYASSCASITAGMCVDTDDGKLYYHNGTAVVEVGSGSYTPPTASADTLGVIKVGSRLTINAEGVLSADVQSGTGAVDSVNGATGTVVLDADDISDTSTTKKFTTAAEKATWNAKQDAVETTPLTVSMITGLFSGTEDCLGANGETVACGGSGGYTNLTEFVGQTAWRLFYSNGSGDIQELALGSSGTVLKSNGTSAAPSFQADATAEGAGYVSTPPTYSDEACTSGQYYNSTAPLRLYSCLGNKWVYIDSTGLVDWNNPTPVAPTLISRVISANGTTLTITGSASLSVGAGGSGGFDLDCAVAGNDIALSNPQGFPGTSVTYTIAETITREADGESCNLDYTQPGNGIEATTGGADLASITSAAITNNSTQSAASYSDILLHWNAENSLSADKGGITGTNSGSIFDSINKAVGSYALAKDGNNDGVSFTISSQFARAGGQIGTWIYTTTGYVAGSANRIFGITDGAGNTINLSINSSNSLTSYWYGNSNPAVVIGTTALSASTWYYVVLKYHPGDAGNDLTMIIYNSAGSVVQTVSEANIAAMTADPTALTFYNTGGDEVRVNVDNFIISNDIARDMWAVRNVTAF